MKDSIPFYNSDLKGILKNLIGNWNFRRLINDALEQKQRYACGNSSFVKNENAENTLNYVETGKLTWDNTKEFNFSRKYIYQLNNKNIDIIFDDGISIGKHFQTLLPANSDAAFIGSEHLCKLDKYNSSYQFVSKDEFIITYLIVGPKKKLTITTTYNKQIN